MTTSPTGSTYAALAHLPLHIDGVATEVMSRRVSTGFRRFTTVYRLSGAGWVGAGEDITYEADEHRRLRRSGATLPLAGRWTLASFSGMLDAIDIHPDGAPAQTASRGYRRWALESAALDLALRQAGVSLAEIVGRDPQPVRFVVSLHLGAEPTLEPLMCRRAACSAVRFKLDATAAWGDHLLGALAESGWVEVIDFKGVYQGTLAEAHTDADLYRRVAEALPAAYLEDPDLAGPAAQAALAPYRDRISWDAPIHSVADVARLAGPGVRVNIKPSRFGTLRALFNAYDYCADHGIGVYGGGQYELGVGRGQIQYLAALFHPDASNDTAPAGYDETPPPADVPCAPMTIIPDAAGFAARAAMRPAA